MTFIFRLTTIIRRTTQPVDESAGSFSRVSSIKNGQIILATSLFCFNTYHAREFQQVALRRCQLQIAITVKAIVARNRIFCFTLVKNITALAAIVINLERQHAVRHRHLLRASGRHVDIIVARLPRREIGIYRKPAIVLCPQRADTNQRKHCHEHRPCYRAEQSPTHTCKMQLSV